MTQEKFPARKPSLQDSIDRVEAVIARRRSEKIEKELKYGVLDPKTGIRTKPKTPEDLSKIVKNEISPKTGESETVPKPKSWMDGYDNY